jgi:hypothetical protein
MDGEDSPRRRENFFGAIEMEIPWFAADGKYTGAL